MKWQKYLLAVICCLPLVAQANLKIAQQYMTSPSEVGKARLTMYFFKVYDATLYAPSGHWQESQPFALNLHYLRDFKGSEITRRSLEEIRAQGYRNEARLTDWSAKLMAIIPDVSAGAEITGVRDSAGNTTFFLGDRKLGMVADPEFTQHFFDIWLGLKTSQPILRRKLIGG